MRKLLASILLLCIALPMLTPALAEPVASSETAQNVDHEGKPCPVTDTPAKKKEKSSFLVKIAPLLILLAAVCIVFWRIPKVKGINHSKEFVRRRVMNWLPLGITYALFYMARYNLTVSKKTFGAMEGANGGAMMGNADFSLIFMFGTIIYGLAFVINGPLTDKIGGRKAMLIGAAGVTLANAVMGFMTWTLVNQQAGFETIANNFVLLFTLAYMVNMYFQSFGAAAIVKVNAPWFHLRERGVFGAIFGILISLGVYLAFDVGGRILGSFGVVWVFLVPTIGLVAFWIIDYLLVRDSPGQAGFDDFDTGDATEEGERLPVKEVFVKMLTNPIILTIAAVEFCSGFMRQAVMQWYQIFAKQTNEALGFVDSFVNNNWGLLLAVAGIMGGVFAGIVSDKVFGSRRGPVASILYGAMTLASVLLIFLYDTYAGWIVIAMSLFVIGVHGMLSGTASMDFGGKKNVGVVVGIIDGFVYLGTGTMSLLYWWLMPEAKFVESCGSKVAVGPAANPDNWTVWPVSMAIVAAIGTLLALRLWNARARPKG